MAALQSEEESEKCERQDRRAERKSSPSSSLRRTRGPDCQSSWRKLCSLSLPRRRCRPWTPRPRTAAAPMRTAAWRWRPDLGRNSSETGGGSGHRQPSGLLQQRHMKETWFKEDSPVLWSRRCEGAAMFSGVFSYIPLDKIEKRKRQQRVEVRWSDMFTTPQRRHSSSAPEISSHCSHCSLSCFDPYLNFSSLWADSTSDESWRLQRWSRTAVLLDWCRQLMTAATTNNECCCGPISK